MFSHLPTSSLQLPLSRRVTAVVGLAIAIAVFPGGAANAQAVFVTTTADVVDFSGGQQVANLPGPDGQVSLREAALAAGNSAGPQTIGFHVPVSGWGSSTIGPVLLNLGSSFAITDDDTTIDGSTQTAFTGDTNPGGAEVSFLSIVDDVEQIQSGTFAVSSDRNRFTGLGHMTGRNYGIDLLPSAEENTVTGCVITGKFAAVRVQGDDNVIGGAAPGLGNRLHSLADGLRIVGLDGNVAEDNLVLGNELSGGFNGVQIAGAATGNVIGGAFREDGNLISRAGYLQEDGTPDGAMLRIEADGNTVWGNLIGTDAAGTAVLDNVGDVGIEIYGDGNYVRGNVVGGITGPTGPLAVQAGIHLREGAEDNVLQGNWIGVDQTGTIPIPNHVGILISAFDASLPMPRNNIIGFEPGLNNVIAHNEAGGIRVLFDAVGNRISGNVLRDNHAAGEIGIDLGGDGPTPNDPGDADTGPNLLMNAPVLSTAVAGASRGAAVTVITGQLDTADPAGALVEIFANAPPSPGEVVEAESFLTATTAKADGSFQVAVAADALGLALTATATDAAGNTSEISPPVSVTPSPWIDLGFGLHGSYGLPLLIGGGPLVPGTDAALLLYGALENSTGFWVIGTSTLFAPAVGGTLVPTPQVIVPLVTGASPDITLVGTWPNVPPGTTLVVQAWIFDAFAVEGVAASNGVMGTGQ